MVAASTRSVRFSAPENLGANFDTPQGDRRYINLSILDDFIEMMGRLTGLGGAGDEIGEDRDPSNQTPTPQVEQAPIVINMEAPRRAGGLDKGSLYGDRTLEALGSGTDAITPGPRPNWRSSGADERRDAQGANLSSGQVRKLVQGRGSGGRRPGSGRQR